MKANKKKLKNIEIQLIEKGLYESQLKEIRKSKIGIYQLIQAFRKFK